MVITMNKEQRDDNGDDDVDDAGGGGGVRNKICHSRRFDILPMCITVKKKKL